MLIITNRCDKDLEFSRVLNLVNSLARKLYGCLSSSKRYSNNTEYIHKYSGISRGGEGL